MPRPILTAILILPLVVIPACVQRTAAEAESEAADGPSRTILFIADGAGVAHWSAAWFETDSLVIARFPVIGLIDPGNVTTPLPESASSATALATGVRTIYGAVAMDPQSQPLTTVLEAAEETGLATGLVTTTHLVDATPAAFAAHVSHRGDWPEIARQMLDQGIEVLMGDGRAYFDTLPARQAYTVVHTAEELGALDMDRVSFLLGLFDIDSIVDPARRKPSLAEMTAIALSILDRNSDGFFLMVENEHTDHRGHDNSPLPTIQAEIMALDAAIRVALEYQARHPGTLVVVAGDHETGGLAVVPDSEGTLHAEYVTTGHTVQLVPLFAIGSSAELFNGVHTNARIGQLLLERVARRQ